MDRYDIILSKIDSGTVTIDEFNQLLKERSKTLSESLPDVVGFNADRIRRRLNPKRKVTAKAFGNTVTPDGLDAKSSLTPKRGAKGSHVDPTKTFRGRKAVSEAMEALKTNWLKESGDWVPTDNPAFKPLVERLLSTDGTDTATADWLYSLLR